MTWFWRFYDEQGLFDNVSEYALASRFKYEVANNGANASHTTLLRITHRPVCFALSMLFPLNGMALSLPAMVPPVLLAFPLSAAETDGDDIEPLALCVEFRLRVT